MLETTIKGHFVITHLLKLDWHIALAIQAWKKEKREEERGRDNQITKTERLQQQMHPAYG
jgi:hypothetical protein